MLKMSHVLKQVGMCVPVHEALRKQHVFFGAAALLSTLACGQYSRVPSMPWPDNDVLLYTQYRHVRGTLDCWQIDIYLSGWQQWELRPISHATSCFYLQCFFWVPNMVDLIGHI